MTERPNRRAIMASSEPLKPEPTIATSTLTLRANYRRLRLLGKVKGVEPLFARAQANLAFGKSFEIPHVRKHATALQTDAIIEDIFE